MINRKITLYSLIIFIIILFSTSFVTINAKCRLIIRDHTLIKMKEGIFQKASAIKTIKIPNGVTKIGDKAFYGNRYIECVEIPVGVTQIGSMAFEGCIKLKKINIPEGMKVIESFAFQLCSSLKQITIPDSVVTIGESAFSLTGLREIVIPEGVEHIGDKAFCESNALRKVIIPKSVISIGWGTFLETLWYNSLGIGDDNCIYSNDLLLGTWNPTAQMDSNEVNTVVEYILKEKYLDNKTENMPSSQDIVIPDLENEDEQPIKIVTKIKIKEGTRLIANGALSDCYFLNKIELPEGLEIIGDKAFANCLSLEEIKIPESVEVIGQDAFVGCKNLLTIKIPRHLKESFNYEGIADVIYY